MQTAESRPFAELVRVLENLSESFKKPNERLRLLSRYIGRFDAKGDLFPVLRLVLPQLDKKRSVYSLKEATLARLYGDILGLPKVEKERLRHYKDPQKLAGTKALAGDFSGVVQAVLCSRLDNSGNLTIGELNALLDEVHSGSDYEAKKAPFTTIIRSTSAFEQKWIVRMILKDMKLGIGHERVLGALHPEAMSLFNSCSDLKEVLDATRSCLDDQRGSLESVAMFRALRPMLAQRLLPSEISSTVSGGVPFIVEPKYDGERTLCHVETQNKRVEFFTRRGNCYTHLYGPCLSECIVRNVKGMKAILDGEMMSWDRCIGGFISFGHNRTVAAGGVDSAQLCYVVFDILLYVHHDDHHYALMQNTLKERRELLRKVVSPVEHTFEVARCVETTDPKVVERELEKVSERREEGIVIKRTDSTYCPNGRNQGWYKLKPNYGALCDTLDLLVLGAYFSDTMKRRVQESTDASDHVSHFLLGVLGENLQAISFCKVGTGYTIQELHHIRAYLRGKLIRYDSPSSAPWMRSFRFGAGEKPHFVLRPEESFLMEVKGAEIVPSDKFDMGMTLRFPRTENAFRQDKKWNDACTEIELLDLAERSRRLPRPSGDPPRETQSDDDRATESKKRRRERQTGTPSKGAPASRILETFQDTKTNHLPEVSRLLEGNEFYVICGEDDAFSGTKSDLDRFIVQHGGKKTQTFRPGRTNFVIAARPTFRTKNVQRMYGVPVLHYEYLFWCQRHAKVMPLEPSFVIEESAEVAAHFQGKFDKYGDSYFADVDSAAAKSLAKHFWRRNFADENSEGQEGRRAQIGELASKIREFRLKRSARSFYDFRKVDVLVSHAPTLVEELRLIRTRLRGTRITHGPER